MGQPKPRLVDFDNCPHCGDELYAMTDESLEPDLFYDGDTVKCAAEPSCGVVGTMVADGETCYVSFDEDED